MRATIIITLIAATAVSGCEAASPTESARAGLAARNAHQSDVPHAVKGSCEVTATDVVAFNPPILQQVGYAVCHISHIGRFNVRTEQSINVATGSQTGSGTWTTPSGDVIYASSTGSAVPTGPGTISFTGVTTLTGGTGRFENAQGELAVEGVGDTNAGTGSFRYSGSIAY